MTPRAKVPVGLGPLRGHEPPRSTWARSSRTSYRPRPMDCYGLLRLHGGVSPTAGEPAWGSTIFRLPRTQQQMPDFRVLTRKIDCINCSDTFNRRRL